MRSPIHTIAVFITIFLAGCTVPLGPGFQHFTRKDLISETPELASPAGAASGQIHLRVTDQLENTGNGEIAYLDVNVPAEPKFDVTSLSFRVNGREIKPALVTRDPGAPTRIVFPTSWKPDEERSIVFDYDLGQGSSGNSAVAASADGFYIVDPSAFPSWRPPEGVFVRADLRARSENLEFMFPAGFHVLASGQEQQPAPDHSTTYEFHISATDFPPFAIGGRYQESVINAPLGRVTFWTSTTLDSNVAQATAERLTATVAEYDRLFGFPTAGTKRHPAVQPPIYVAESSTLLPAVHASFEDEDNQADASTEPSALSFPEGALLDKRAFARGISSEPVLELVEYEIAQTWFGWRVQVRPDAEVLLRDGMALFAVIDAAGVREGPAARNNRISALITSFDHVRAQIPARVLTDATQNAPLVPVVPKTPEERAASARKSALFFVALEDLAGKEKFERAMHRMLRDLAGESASDADLRSAMEAATGRNLDSMFREWISLSDLPPAFRQKYRPHQP